MSTIALNNNTAIGKKSGNTVMGRVADYLIKNQTTITLALYSVSGHMPSVEMLRAMKVL